MTSTGDLHRIREEQKRLMPETVYIQRLTRVSDGAGGWSEVWQTVATTQGRLAPREGRGGSGEEVRGGAMTPYGEYIVTLPYEVVISPSDRLQIQGTHYEVTSILERSEKTAVRVIVEMK
jgi:hypothetical protein